MVQDEGALIKQIAEAIASPQSFYSIAVPDRGDVESVRRCGRAAGRRVGVRVRTVHIEGVSGASDAVWIGNIEPIDPQDEVAQRRRQQELREIVQRVGADLDPSRSARQAAADRWGVDPRPARD